jgi:crossover junction endodeoxyribonuclease RusA
VKSFSFSIPGRPRPKGRPRVSARGFVYTDSVTREYEKFVGNTYKEANGPVFDGSVCLVIKLTSDKTDVTISEIDEHSKLRSDIDNLVKSILDGLNGIAFKDDKQVLILKAYKN